MQTKIIHRNKKENLLAQLSIRVEGNVQVRKKTTYYKAAWHNAYISGYAKYRLLYFQDDRLITAQDVEIFDKEKDAGSQV